jgi:hypothetical protein
VGSFYGNVTLLGSTLDGVRAVSPTPAFVAVDGECIVVFAEVDDDGSMASGALLSDALGCVAFSASVHDDDILSFAIHDHGQLKAAGAVPDPAEYFGFDAEMLADVDPAMLADFGVPSGGTSDTSAEPSEVVEALGRGDAEAVRDALTNDFVFATERHQALVEALGLSGSAVGWGYRYLANDSDSYSGAAFTRL